MLYIIWAFYGSWQRKCSWPWCFIIDLLWCNKNTAYIKIVLGPLYNTQLIVTPLKREHMYYFSSTITSRRNVLFAVIHMQTYPQQECPALQSPLSCLFLLCLCVYVVEIKGKNIILYQLCWVVSSHWLAHKRLSQMLCSRYVVSKWVGVCVCVCVCR